MSSMRGGGAYKLQEGGLFSPLLPHSLFQSSPKAVSNSTWCLISAQRTIWRNPVRSTLLWRQKPGPEP